MSIVMKNESISVHTGCLSVNCYNMQLDIMTLDKHSFDCSDTAI